MSCPICSSAQMAEPLTIHYWREHPLRFEECQSCRACFADPMPPEEVITQGQEALDLWQQQDRTFSLEFRAARQAYLRGKLLAQRLERWKARGKLLDLGCYNGFLPLGVRDTSEWQVEGVVASRRLAEF